MGVIVLHLWVCVRERDRERESVCVCCHDGNNVHKIDMEFSNERYYCGLQIHNVDYFSCLAIPLIFWFVKRILPFRDIPTCFYGQRWLFKEAFIFQIKLIITIRPANTPCNSPLLTTKHAFHVLTNSCSSDCYLGLVATVLYCGVCMHV